MLTELDADIRSSVQSEDFERTQRLLEQYRDALENRVRSAAHPQAECSVLGRQAKELYEWVRRMTLLSRAKYQTRLGVLRTTAPYLSAASTEPPHPRFHLKA